MKKKMYAFSDIREIVLTSFNGNKLMRLIFADFRHKEVVASGLANEDWLALLKLIRGYGLEVKDENNFEELVKPEEKRFSRNLNISLTLYMLLHMLICAVSYTWITSLSVSDNMLILLKIIWLVLMIPLFLIFLKLGIKGAEKRSQDINK